MAGNCWVEISELSYLEALAMASDRAFLLHLRSIHLCLLLFHHRLLRADPLQSPGWDWISTLDRMNASQFRELAWPLVQMSANAYRYPGHVPIQGWQRSSLVPPLAPRHGGAHALVYEQTQQLTAYQQQDQHKLRVYKEQGEYKSRVYKEQDDHRWRIYEEQDELKLRVYKEEGENNNKWRVYRKESENKARVYREQDENGDGGIRKGRGERIVVAFRGTDLSGDESSQADTCADAILFGNDSRVAPLPNYCKKFSNGTLDYFSQALDYTRKVMAAYPDSPLLLTGHSLGATLSILVSAALSEVLLLPVVGFSAGGAKNILKEKSLMLEAEKRHEVFVISNEWDEVMRTSWEKQVGVFCYYETKIPAACEICFQKTSSPLLTRPPLDDGIARVLNGGNPSDRLKDLSRSVLNLQTIPLLAGENACLDCFFKTHYLKSVMSLVDAGTQPDCINFNFLPASA